MDFRKNIRDYLLISAVPLLFLIIGTVTLKDYGINWDEPFHFMRGQAYLHFFLTGEKDYHSLPAYPRINNCTDSKTVSCSYSPGGPSDRENWWGKNPVYENAIKLLYPKDVSFWRSYYQHDTYTFNEIIKSENGHPAVGDTLAAFFNYIFYGKLHILGDIESYHFFEVVTAFLIVLGVAVIIYSEFGVFPAMVAAFSLAAYPLFFSESHFNIKDPILASYYGLALILLYFGVIKKKWKLIVLSSVFAGFALGTKLNIVFAPLIAVPWLIYFLVTKYLSTRKIFLTKGMMIAMIFYVPIAVGIVYALWPYLWSNPLSNALHILDYYKQIGIRTPTKTSSYLVNGWNTYPVLWIIYTTQIPILFLSIIGIIYSIYLVIRKKRSFPLLVLLFLFVPIVRVSWPGIDIYGGVRQIMEYVPALAILSGIGAFGIVGLFKKFKAFPITVITLSMLFVTYEMIKIHPNENVYFNQLVGGLAGARNKNIPYWGNSYGNAYQQGINWLNKNAEPNAKLGLPISTMGNIPWIKLRSDIDFANSNWSGPAKNGEYEIELSFDWAPTNWYSFAYYDTYLDPVFIAQVDGVPILKVWKNDLTHTKKGFEKEEIYPIYSFKKDEASLWIDMGKEILLTRITIYHTSTSCNSQKGGYIAISRDGKNWSREPEPIDYPQVPPAAVNITDNNFVFLFAAKKARYIFLDTALKNSCLLKKPSIEIKGLSL